MDIFVVIIIALVVMAIYWSIEDCKKGDKTTAKYNVRMLIIYVLRKIIHIFFH